MSEKPILIVDDSRNILVTLSSALEKLGRPVEITAYAEDALLRLSQAQYALLILDVELWGISGLEMLKRMKRQGFSVPVMIITAYGNSEMEAEARSLGVADFVSKPFSPKEIRTRVTKVLEAAEALPSV